MKEVWFVRHAESVANAGGTTPDPASIALTEKGHQQAEKLTKAFSIKPDLFITSPFLRTKQTAAPTLAKFPEVPVEEWAVQEFSYLSPVIWANTSSEDRAPRTDWYWENCDPIYNDGDGAESFNDLVVRVEDALVKLITRPEKYIVMFSHGQFLKTLWYQVATGNLISAASLTPKENMKRMDLIIRGMPFPNTAILKMHDDKLSPLSTLHLSL